jgi:hypothetical protein
MSATALLFAGLVVADPSSAQTLANPCTIPPDTINYSLVVGTEANDNLVGTGGNDIILGMGGDDAIRGFGGNDVLCGQAGDDGIHGGDGNDFVDGGDGEDVIIGAVGDDTLYGGDFYDGVYGGPGNDTLGGGRFEAVGAVDDVTPDYVLGNDGTDNLGVLGLQDEAYTDSEADGICTSIMDPLTTETLDTTYRLAKLGVYDPERLVVEIRDTDQRPCRSASGQIEKVERHGDGDLTTGESDGLLFTEGSLTFDVLELISLPPNYPANPELPVGVDPTTIDLTARTAKIRVHVELMPRDVNKLPLLSAGQTVQIDGLRVLDENEGHADPSFPEIHPVFHIRVSGIDYYSGPKYAGSPSRRYYPPSVQTTRPPGLTSTPYVTQLPRSNFCWLPSGPACQSWSGFTYTQQVN